jgi:choline dehydrogenase-like flavoprotein
MSSSDVIVVGSGPAGALVARDLARAWMRVTLLEQGGEAGPPAPNLWKLWRQREMLHIAPGVALLRGVRIGGGSTAFYHTATNPPLAMFSRHGVDLREDVRAVLQEIPHQPLPHGLIGAKGQQIAYAERKLGLPWQPLPKMIYQERCAGGECPPAAFWSAQALLNEATALGAKLEAGVRVRRVLFSGGQASGVEIDGASGPRTLHAGRVILAAGGLGSPAILRRSGIEAAGQGFFCDPLRIAIARGAATSPSPRELPMSAGMIDEAAGCVLSDIAIPESFFRTFSWRAGRLDMLPRYRQSLMIMVKIRDDILGEIRSNGRAWRHFSAADKAKMHEGMGKARHILEAAGGRGVFFSPWLAAHPGGSVRLGHLLDARLACQVPNLHVCDASAIPEPWGLPPTVAILSLAKYLARILIGETP